MKKSERIISLLNQLRSALGENSFVIADYWDADLNAIGITSPSNKYNLVYINVFGKKSGKFDVQLESKPENNSSIPYKPAGEFENQSFDQLVNIIRKHFKSE